jgi:WD40 repeat protein
MRLNYFSRWRKPLWAASLCLAFLGAGPCRQPEVQAQTNSQSPARPKITSPDWPTQPMLRIEAGMHTNKINRIGVDAAGRYLVTGSDDKTARVWDVATGRLLRTLRPPIGARAEGVINAVAISPDGRFVVAGGITGYKQYDKSGEYSVYLFDRETGALVEGLRISDLYDYGTVPLSMDFSMDGAKLVIGTARVDQNIAAFNMVSKKDSTSDYFKPGGYKEQIFTVSRNRYNLCNVNGIDFDRSGRLITSCSDGYLRLYDKDLQMLRQVRAPGGDRLYAVRFSPDGSKLALGYDDSARVDVLDANSLKGLYQPDTSGVSGGDLRAVAWSADGSALYAAGGWHNGTGSYLIRRWADAGRGRYQDSAAAGDTIMDLASMPDGGVAFGSQEPSWGVISARGERLRFVDRETADYRDSKGSFLTNDTGSVVGFSYEPSGKSPARFSVADRRLNAAGADSALRPPRIDGLPITDWRDSQSPTLNGQIKLKLLAGDVSRALAVAPDGQSFLLAGDSSMRLFGQKGNELWTNEIPGPARSVNISGNGKLAIGAFADGAIRWYRMTDGKELLTFFPHKDRKRWVSWTPSGYYDFSPGAEDLIGWHVNADIQILAQTPNFFPAERFRSERYRPDVISRILETGDEAQALKLANEKGQGDLELKKRFAPVISVISPANDSEIKSSTVVVRYSLRSPSDAPVTGIKVLIDGRPAGVERGPGKLPKNGQKGQLTLTVPSRDCEIALVAENKYTSSVASMARLRWRGAPEAELLKPKLYILAVGVAQYSNPSLSLNYPAKDARDFVEAMRSQEGGLYRKVESKLLTDKLATKDNIMDGLEWVQRQTTSRDVAMVFFAGRDFNDTRNRYFLCSHNFEEQSLMRTGVAYSDIRSAVEAIAGKAIFFVDTCHVGKAAGSSDPGNPADINLLINELSGAGNGVIVFTAGAGKQVSLEDAQWGNGAFTKALVEGLKGAADVKKQGNITVTMLDSYMSERVKELTGGKQTPTTVKPETASDFPIATVK